MMATEPLYAGIDLGGTKILVVIADADGNIRGDGRTPTRASEGPRAVVDRISACVRESAREAGIDPSDIEAAGVSAPGPIDAAEGVITDPPNLPGWHDVPLARLLSECLGTPATLENDANCGAIGEHQFGAGRGFRHMLYVTVSTGIGGGIIIDDELYAGASGAAGEVGHMPVALDGPHCGAGHVGCLEAFASGTAIARRAQEMIDAGGLPRTARIAAQHPPLTAEDVYLAGQQGESEAANIIESAGSFLGIGLAGMINAFNPQAIVIGGGLVNMGGAILGPARRTARERAFEQSFRDVHIVEWELGERVAALGAIAVARKRRTAARR
jgi:glucokinase